MICFCKLCQQLLLLQILAIVIIFCTLVYIFPSLFYKWAALFVLGKRMNLFQLLFACLPLLVTSSILHINKDTFVPKDRTVGFKHLDAIAFVQVSFNYSIYS